MKKILGIDCSSTTIGWCLLAVDGESISLIQSGYIKPIKKGTIVDRIVNTRDTIKKLIDDLSPDYIGIEEIIKFMKGKSSAQTIITLTTFNRMICLLAHDYLKTNPSLFSVMAIRHGLKLNNSFPKKEDMPELVAKHLGITFPYERNKKGNLKVENYDRADGIAVALYYGFKLTGKLNKSKRKVKLNGE